jgi:hypothetical protein
VANKPSYTDLEHKIKKLESQALDYKRKEEIITDERKRREFSHWKRTVSLVRINEELNKRIKKIAGIKSRNSK